MSEVIIKCECGHASVSLNAIPRVRFRCHCTKCQSVYRAPYADAMFLRRGQAKLLDNDTIEWVNTKQPSPLVRGICRKCKDPILAHFFGITSIVPTKAVTTHNVPKVTCDIYYKTRVADIDDNLPKYNSAFMSYVGLSLPILGVLALSKG